jgi:Family of unknown function (DUF6788)
MATTTKSTSRLLAYQQAYRNLAAEISAVGYICSGSVVRQRLRCGKERCACHRDDSRRHGPYFYWTTKVKGRTVSKLLNAQEAELYGEWIRNRRRLEEIHRKMRDLSRKVAPLLLNAGELGP